MGLLSCSSPDSYTNYEYAEQTDDLKPVNAQTWYVSCVVAFIFIIGSLCIIVGKWIEYKDLKASDLSTHSAEQA